MDLHLQQLRREAALGDSHAQERYLRARIRAGKRVLLGMSLSFCIKTLLQGSVTEDEVVAIIGSTTGFVENGKPGPNYEEIIDHYMSPYWRGYSRQQVDDVLAVVLSRMTEQTHGLPGTWIDASKPHYWGWVPHGCHLGVVGDYINTETNEVIYPASELQTRFREDEESSYPPGSWAYPGRYKIIRERADALNTKYGFLVPKKKVAE
jgi:hypothetical protein